MRFLISYIFCCCISFSVCAQTSQLDSLTALLAGKKGDERFDVLSEMVNKVQRSNMPIIRFCAEEAMRILPDISDSFRIARAYQMKCFVLYSLNKEDEILPYLLKGLDVSRKIKSDPVTGYFLNLYGILSIPKGEYGKALSYLLESIRLQGPNSKDIGIRYNNVGLIYYKVKNNRKAIHFYEKALAINRPDFEDMGTLLINIGLAYGQLKEYSRALDYVDRGLNSCRSNCEEVQIGSSFAFGFIKYDMGNVVDSEPHFKHSLLLARTTPNRRFISENLVRLAQIYVDSKRFDLAAESLQEAEVNSIKYDFNELLLNTYNIFISLYHAQNNLQKLSSYYLKYNALRETLHGRELLQQISVFEVDMEHEANLKTMAHQKQVLRLQKESLLRQQWINYGMFVLMLLVVVILFLLWRRNIQRRKVKVLLEQRITQRREYLRTKKELQQDKNDRLARYAGEQLERVYNLIHQLQRAGTDLENYKFQLEQTIVQMDLIFKSTRVLQEVQVIKSLS